MDVTEPTKHQQAMYLGAETGKLLHGSLLRSWPLSDGRVIAEIDVQGSDRIVVCLTPGDRVADADGGIFFNPEEVLGLRSKAYPMRET